MRNLDELIIAFKIKQKCIWVHTNEYEDFVNDLTKLVTDTASNNPVNVFTWSTTEGIRSMAFNKETNKTAWFPFDDKAKEFPQLFDRHILAENGNEDIITRYWVIKDFHFYISNPKAISYIRSVKKNNSKANDAIIILSSAIDIPDELTGYFKIIEYALPQKDEIMKLVNEYNNKTIEAAAYNDKYKPLSDDEIEDFVLLCEGFSKTELVEMLRESLAKYYTLSRDVISSQKIKKVKATGSLNYKEPEKTLNDIGGHEELKKWLRRQMKIINNKEAAKKFGRKAPKGFMAVGIAGAGKSAIAEAFAGEMNVPLLIFDMSKVMNRMVGESEKGIARALKTAASCSPCVLLMDEVEKALGGYASSASADSGVTDRIVGTLCSWMQDNEDVFIIMTSNNAAKLPPEFTRAGRLDTSWFFNFPTAEERTEILDVHLQKTHQSLTEEQKEMIVNMTDHFTGAELEQGLQNAIGYLFEDYLEDGSEVMTDTQIINGFNDVIPIYRSSRGAMNALVKYYTEGEGKARMTNAVPSSYTKEVNNDEEKWSLDF